MAIALSVVSALMARSAQCGKQLTVAALSAAVLMSVTACSTKSVDKTESWSPNKIYTEAKDEMSSSAYDKAIPLFEKLEGRAAGTPLAQQAQLEKAYAQFKAGEAAQAIATLERFEKLHPSSPAVDYALYLKGIINFNDDLGLFGKLASQDLSERDQKRRKNHLNHSKTWQRAFQTLNTPLMHARA